MLKRQPKGGGENPFASPLLVFATG